ncbi:MAG: DUF402 domain-containing protein [Actinobacteria bacterium]|nr:DUF402 domain-containing protein [Actinomycetota bacterium]
MWSSGDVVALRHLNGGRSSHVWPMLVVEDSPGVIALYIATGTPTKRRARLDGSPLDRALPYEERHRVPWRLGDGSWFGSSCLQLHRPGEPRAWWRWLDGSGWYVNLQAPLRRTGSGFATEDWVLDVVVAANGTWAWKDEDEFAAAQRVGRFDADAAAAVRDAGDDAVVAIESRSWPLDGSWETWVPDAAWVSPDLPEGWDVV